jgi:hypothetical protein
MDQQKVDYMFAPLESMDVKSLTLVAEKLKQSLNKTDKAVGAFLLRYADYRSDGRVAGKGPSAAGHNLSQLRDLR